MTLLATRPAETTSATLGTLAAIATAVGAHDWLTAATLFAVGIAPAVVTALRVQARVPDVARVLTALVNAAAVLGYQRRPGESVEAFAERVVTRLRADAELWRKLPPKSLPKHRGIDRPGQ